MGNDNRTTYHSIPWHFTYIVQFSFPSYVLFINFVLTDLRFSLSSVPITRHPLNHWFSSRFYESNELKRQFPWKGPDAVWLIWKAHRVDLSFPASAAATLGNSNLTRCSGCWRSSGPYRVRLPLYPVDINLPSNQSDLISAHKHRKNCSIRSARDASSTRL